VTAWDLTGVWEEGEEVRVNPRSVSFEEAKDRSVTGSKVKTGGRLFECDGDQVGENLWNECVGGSSEGYLGGTAKVWLYLQNENEEYFSREKKQ